MAKRRRSMPATVEKLLEDVREMSIGQVLIDRDQPGLGKELAMRQLLARATAVLSSGVKSSEPDGFGATTPGNGSPGGGKGGGPTMKIDIPERERRVPQSADGQEWLDSLHPNRRGAGQDPVPTSSTEVAAIATLDRRGRTDPIEAITYEIIGDLRMIRDGMLRLAHALDRRERLRSITEVEDPPQCWVASVMHKLPYDPEWELELTATKFDGVLEHPWDEEHKVCRWVYVFTRRHERLPLLEEMLQHLSKGYVRVQTGTSTTRRAS